MHSRHLETPLGAKIFKSEQCCGRAYMYIIYCNTHTFAYEKVYVSYLIYIFKDIYIDINVPSDVRLCKNLQERAAPQPGLAPMRSLRQRWCPRPESSREIGSDRPNRAPAKKIPTKHRSHAQHTNHHTTEHTNETHDRTT